MCTYIGIPFGHDNFIIVEDSNGSVNAKFRAKTVESIGFATGNTVPKAARALVASIRRTADEMEAAIDKWEKKMNKEDFSKQMHCLVDTSINVQREGQAFLPVFVEQYLKWLSDGTKTATLEQFRHQQPKDFGKLMKDLGVPEIK